LSSAETLISEIEEAYRELKAIIDDLTSKSEKDAYKERYSESPKGLSRKEGMGIFHEVMKFQRFLEVRQNSINVFRNVPYYDRAASKFAEVLEMVRSKDVLPNVTERPKGLHWQAKDIINYCRGESGFCSYQSSRLGKMQETLGVMEIELSELYSDARLLQEMLTFPIGERTRVKTNMLREGFEESAKFLESAEQAMVLEPPRPKDAMTNCRLAAESLLYAIMKKKGVTVTNWFAKDLLEMTKSDPELIDEGMQRVLRGAFEYLSVKGPHPISKVDQKNLSEGTFGLDYAYLVISHLLSRYISLKRQRGKGSQQGSST
jgi:hypothetical protein